MIIRHKNGKDLGEPNWRISININGEIITIKTENFKYGFRIGEDWDKIAVFNSSHGQYEEYVSVITKYPNKMEGFKPLMIEKLYEIINKNIKLQNQILLREKDKLARYENHLTSDLFKVI